MSPIDLLALLPIILKLIAGKGVNSDDVRLLANIAQKLLTPENLEKAKAFLVKHGPEVIAEVRDGVLWLKAHNESHPVATVPPGWFEAGGEWYPPAEIGPPLDPDDPVYKNG